MVAFQYHAFPVSIYVSDSSVQALGQYYDMILTK